MKYKSIVCDSKEFIAGFDIHKGYWKSDHLHISIDRFIEEASELIKELLKLKRGRVERGGKPIAEAIKDEYADLQLCLEYIARSMNFTTEEIQQRITAKSLRIVENLKQGRH